MHVHDAILVAVGLGMDAMSVSAAIGVKWHGPRQKFRLAWHMGLFQFFMPILGWSGGRRLAEAAQQYGSYVAAGLVFAIGAKMLYEALRSKPGALEQKAEHLVEARLHAIPKDPTRGWSLLALALGTSIDALVVGFSLGLRGEGGAIWWVSLMIGVVAGMMALSGVVLGRRIGQAVGKPAEVIGAAVLMGLAISFLFLK
jgi:putative Mn2+ efflux pump MntP